MRVLIVEDDRRLADVVREGLEESGITADIVGDASSAVRAASSLPYDIVLLDVMLGAGADGFEVCRRLRERDVAAKVLMLTALDGVPDRVRGLNAGADDYLVKPFAFSELLARLHALMRRRGDARPLTLRAGALSLDSGSRRAVVGNEELALTRKEFDILELLLSHSDQVISKERILEQVWGVDAAGENLVEVHVARLRRKIAAAGGGDPIGTVRHAGYRLEDPRRAALTGR